MNIYQQLSDPFPQEMEKTLRKGGSSLTYIPISEVIARLNRVIGVNKWDSIIMSCERDAIDSDFIVAHVRVTAEIEGSTVVKDGIGGQRIKRTKSGDIVDLGDEMKGAVSDALKKAVQQLGVGLYLARDIDAIEIEYAMDSEPEQPSTSSKEALYQKFMEIRSMLDDAQVTELREYWKNYSGGRPVPKASEFTVEELNTLITECTRLHFDGEYTVGANG